MSSAPMTPPMTPAKERSVSWEKTISEKGPFLITTTAEGLTPLQRHCAYFDRNGDNILTPWDTWVAFRDLGYGLLLSTLGTFFVHLFFSYPTLDTWVPDPFFSIHLKNIHRCIHGSDSGSYNNLGELTTLPIDSMMMRFDTEQKEGLDFKQGWALISTLRDINDPFGWMAAILEWGFLWALAADYDGVVSFDAIRSQYDGTLFYKIRDQRKAISRQARPHQQ